ncbi:MAG: hypothetical protein CME65_08640 [Halobacteriovoraceae bacterium]|nr:hypothetical protein [Halobacteriovoraceae bacterium]|tara:strand:+ start:5508 stop:6140 length:633 start_codon:yes stop_codon:yes gene_type:complete
MKSLVLILLFTACRLPPQEGGLEFETIRLTQNAESINFATIQSEILGPNCTQCHPGYSDYETVRDNLTAIEDSIKSGRMPKDRPNLAPDLQLLIEEWIKLGAPSESPIQRTVLAPNWDSISKKIIFPKCAQCHNPQGQAAFLDLSTYEAILEQKDYLIGDESGADSYLMEVIQDPQNPMPPEYSGLEQLNVEEVQTMIEWIDKNLPESDL